MANVPEGIPRDISGFHAYIRETKKLIEAYHRLKKAKSSASREKPPREVRDPNHPEVVVNQVYLNTVKKMIQAHWTTINKSYSLARKGRRTKQYNPNTGFLRLQKIDPKFLNYIKDPNVSMGVSKLADGRTINNKDYIAYLLNDKPYGSAALMTTIFSLIIREMGLAKLPAKATRRRRGQEEPEPVDAIWIVADENMKKYLRSDGDVLTGYIREKKPDFDTGKVGAPSWDGFGRELIQTILTNLRTRTKPETGDEKQMHQKLGLPNRPVLTSQEDTETKLDDKTLHALGIIIKYYDTLLDPKIKPKEKKYYIDWLTIAAMTGALVDIVDQSMPGALDKILKKDQRDAERKGTVPADPLHKTLEEWITWVADIKRTGTSNALDTRATEYMGTNVDLTPMKQNHTTLYYRAQNDRAQQRLSSITSKMRAEAGPKKKKPKKPAAAATTK